MTIGEVVSLEAGSAVTVFSVFFALVRDRNADSVSILEPVVGASQADLSIPVPDTTSEVSGFHVVGS